MKNDVFYSIFQKSSGCKLNNETFLQITSTDAGWLKCLNDIQNFLNLFDLHLKNFRRFFRGHRQISVIVNGFYQIPANLKILPFQVGKGQLKQQRILQCFFLADKLLIRIFLILVFGIFPLLITDIIVLGFFHFFAQVNISLFTGLYIHFLWFGNLVTILLIICLIKFQNRILHQFILNELVQFLRIKLQDLNGLNQFRRHRELLRLFDC